MSEFSIIAAVAIVAAIAGFLVANARGQKGARDDGRLTLDSKNATTKVMVTTGQPTSATVADAIESTLASIPDPAAAAAAAKPGIHFSANVMTNVKMVFKLPSKELADAIAERERAKGMSVEVASPDATDPTWRVTAKKP